MKRYGIAYQGSKNKIAEWVVDNLPHATRLYDLFAGGCAITHCSMIKGKYKEIVCNDITDSALFFNDVVNGKYNNESRWISRDDFFRLKDIDPYVRILWSFGNDQRSYIYSYKMENFKKALHEMVYATTPRERLLKFKNVVDQLIAINVLNINPNTMRLESFERLHSLERISALNTPPHHKNTSKR